MIKHRGTVWFGKGDYFKAPYCVGLSRGAVGEKCNLKEANKR